MKTFARIVAWLFEHTAPEYIVTRIDWQNRKLLWIRPDGREIESRKINEKGVKQ